MYKESPEKDTLTLTYNTLLKQRKKLKDLFTQLTFDDYKKGPELAASKEWLLRIVKSANHLKDALNNDFVNDLINWKDKEKNYVNALDELSRLEQENKELK